VEPWSYLKFPYLKSVGWKGLVDGADSGVYRVNALARLNVANGMATPLAQAAYDEMYDFFGTRPVHNTLAFHWARLVETMFACEEVLRLAQDRSITSKDTRVIPTQTPTEGVGVVEAARGTLIHHYQTDARGMTTKVNLIVATVQNNAAMCMSVKKAATALIRNGKVNDGILNRVEMAFRAYDPCLACATHTLPGQMPLEVRIRYTDGSVVTRSRGLQ
ncbi:MAG: Ni/Fe hydrogenase subunit alpha, partial [Proteobacteria bacterium]|nr:Ni/Fe hydrogenase subunit alpha [Pseudomonadota bacterium]